MLMLLVVGVVGDVACVCVCVARLLVACVLENVGYRFGASFDKSDVRAM
jgi:hypothetical protein